MESICRYKMAYLAQRGVRGAPEFPPEPPTKHRGVKFLERAREASGSHRGSTRAMNVLDLNVLELETNNKHGKYAVLSSNDDEILIVLLKIPHSFVCEIRFKLVTRPGLA